jgi:CBS domain-containing protein
MIARDLMTRDVITVSPTTSLKNLATILIKNQISGAPVVAKNGKIIGIVSEANIVAKKGRDVKAIMSKKVISLSEETPVDEIARLMTTHKIGRLPVMRRDEVVGVVSRADIVNAMATGKHVVLHKPVMISNGRRRRSRVKWKRA